MNASITYTSRQERPASNTQQHRITGQTSFTPCTVSDFTGNKKRAGF
jgi:hypothetical protein